MPTPAEDSSFLSRWSRRKAQVRQEESAGAASPPAAVAVVAVASEPAQPVTLEAAVALPVALPVPTPAHQLPAAPAQPSNPAPPPPTMADVAALTRDSDFSRFVGRSVQPDVKNAALSSCLPTPTST
jgi:hypothetical protein